MSLARHCPALPWRGSLRLRSRMQRMCLGGTRNSWPRPPNTGIWMDVRSPVHPGSSPTLVIQEYGVPAPIEPDTSRATAPRREEAADAYAEAEADRAADSEP